MRSTGVRFLEFERNEGVSRSHYMTPCQVKGRLLTTLLDLVTLPRLLTLIKLMTFLELVNFLFQGRSRSSLQV